MYWKRYLSVFLIAFWMVACGGTQTDPTPGTTEFITEENSDSPNTNDGNYGGIADDGAEAAPNASQDAPQGRDGEVEEADIYRIDNNRLFYLNTYRGFIIYDLNDPNNPKEVSRLPIYGYPTEMFVDGTTVYALVRDVLYLTQSNQKLEFKRHHVSQLIAVDVSDITNPKVIKRTDIIGNLREGVSRKIEDTIYVVSYIPQYYYWGWNYGNTNNLEEQAWVYSFNVKDPQNPYLVEKLKIFEGGSYSVQDPNGASVDRYFSSVQISATSNTLMVVENWRKYGYVPYSPYQCGSYTSLSQAVVSIIDISDPTGRINLYSKFETYGSLTDQFKMTYRFDETSKKATFFGIFSRREWSSSNCTGSSFTQNSLESWDITDGANPVRVDALAFGKPDETVRGSAYDLERDVVYAITARNVDPLYAIDISDPTNLKIRSEIDGLSGDMNVFRLIGDGNYLIGIGRDNSDACEGFGSPTTGWSSNVAVSIIDVRDLDKIRLVQRQCVAVKNAEWISSAVNWNLDQAHKMIGMHSDGRENVITVPVYYWKKSGDGDWYWYGYETAVGLMAWDLNAYDDTKPPQDQTVLKNYGTLIHPKGQVKRSIVFTHKGTTDRRMVLNLSDTNLSLFDVEDLNNPVQKAEVEVAPYVQQVYRFGDYLVEHIGQPSYYYYWYDGANNDAKKSEFRVKKIDKNVEKAPVVTSFSAGQIARVVKHKNALILFRYVPLQADQDYRQREVEAAIYDFSDPTKPILASTIRMSYQMMPYFYYWCGVDGYWGSYYFGDYMRFTGIDSGLVSLTYDYDYQANVYNRKINFLDLRDIKKPVVREYALSTNQNTRFDSLVADTTNSDAFFLNRGTFMGKKTKPDGQVVYQYKYYAQRWKASPAGLSADVSINIPGRLVKTIKNAQGQTLLLTEDRFYERHPVPNESWYYTQTNYRLNLLKLTSSIGVPVASLLDSRLYSSYYLRDLVVKDQKIIINAQRDYYYRLINNLDWDELSDQLIVLDLSQDTLDETYNESTGTYRVELIGTYKDNLIVALPGDGIVVVDMTQPSQLVGKKFLRTLGWARSVEFSGDELFVASGYFGLYQMSLNDPVYIPITTTTPAL